MKKLEIPIPIHRLAYLQAYLHQIFTLDSNCKKNFDNTKWYEWKPIDGATGGFFEEVTYTTSADAEASIGVDAGETPYSYPDYVFVKFTETTEVIKGETITTQTGVTGFAASGKFLNWASASKFDIQKFSLDLKNEI